VRSGEWLARKSQERAVPAPHPGRKERVLQKGATWRSKRKADPSVRELSATSDQRSGGKRKNRCEDWPLHKRGRARCPPKNGGRRERVSCTYENGTDPKTHTHKTRMGHPQPKNRSEDRPLHKRGRARRPPKNGGRRERVSCPYENGTDPKTYSHKPIRDAKSVPRKSETRKDGAPGRRGRDYSIDCVVFTC